MAEKDQPGVKVACRNRRATHTYHVEKRQEAGIVLMGTEVKSLRDGQADLSDAYASFKGTELFLLNLHISEYVNAGYMKHEPKRPRKLLMHRHELVRLRVKLNERGYTLVPLSIYFKNGRAKVELGLASGKRKVDRRQDVRKKDEDRDQRRQERESTRR